MKKFEQNRMVQATQNELFDKKETVALIIDLGFNRDGQKRETKISSH